jgi:heat shock protein HslJ
MLELADGSINGFAGCNRYFGRFQSNGDSLTIGPLATTVMACEQPIVD